jgi:hypothetical protein
MNFEEVLKLIRFYHSLEASNPLLAQTGSAKELAALFEKEHSAYFEETIKHIEEKKMDAEEIQKHFTKTENLELAKYLKLKVTTKNKEAEIVALIVEKLKG